MTEDTDKLQFAQEILMIRRKTCDNCWHHRDGDCVLCSVDCATAVGRQAANPPRWTSYEDGEAQEARVFKLTRRS